MEYIKRTKSLLTGKANVEPLHTFRHFPVFMGCTQQPPEEDLFADMEWQICRDTGIIQLAKLLPLEILYQNQHNEGCGAVWTEHYLELTKFIAKYGPKRVLEIGGAHGIVAQQYVSMHPNAEWTIIEPNPTFSGEDRIRVLKGWFDDAFSFDREVDAVVHSHVFEHTYDPPRFLSHIASFLPAGKLQIFAFPNMYELVKKKYTSGLNFEHTAFLTEDITEYLLARNGFRVLEKSYFKDHSIFYATEKIHPPASLPVFENRYAEYRDLFMEFVNYHLELIADLNEKISKATTSVYLFGAHIFSQYLIGFGLHTDAIVAVLDNGAAKQGKRLYGTKFNAESPKVLVGKGPVNIILKAGIYNEEIKKDILENINSEAVFW